jgi:hypothetical protein
MGEMRRGRSQVIWRYLPGSSFRYNDGGPWCQTVSVALRDVDSLKGPLISALSQVLQRWRAISPAGYPDPESQAGKYEVGEPYQVEYTLWPAVFECRRCRRIIWYRDLATLREKNDRVHCYTCRKPSLRQVPYAYVCECGRIDSVYIPKHEGRHKIVLEERGTFRDSYWRCEECGQVLARDSRSGLGFRQCECRPRKAKRGIPLEDGRLFYSQTLTMVEVRSSLLEPWQSNPRFGDLLLGGALRTPVYEPRHILDLAKVQAAGGLSPELSAMRKQLLSGGMDAALVDQMIAAAIASGAATVWPRYSSELQPLSEVLPEFDWSKDRSTIEYLFVRDEPAAGAISLETLVREAADRGDAETANRLGSDRDEAASLGLEDLRIVEALPTLLAGFGYSRYFAGPQDGTDEEAEASLGATLRPYTSRSAGKIPIFAARNQTEALLYHLDPFRLAAFLFQNRCVEDPAEWAGTETRLRAWLLGRCAPLLRTGESHLVLHAWEREDGLEVDPASALAFGVLHTLSHVLKATAGLYVGLDSNALAEYLFPAQGAGLLYVAQYVNFSLGGLDSAFRSNLSQWLMTARDYADRCSFDPVCAETGGACSACLYPKFGCRHFNRTVSRSFLFGGEVLGREDAIVGYWAESVAAHSRTLRKQAG